MNLLGDTLDALIVFQNLIFDVDDIIILMKFQLEIFFAKFIMEVSDNFLGTDKVNSFLVIRL
mgnify:CR=1 FL=1|tara:strand:- start:448 stop:633 length:186 start_codon:yes stop_codon:yes gene_type:complete